MHPVETKVREGIAMALLYWAVRVAPPRMSPLLSSAVCDDRTVVREAITREREACVEIVGGAENYWNSVAYDRRQAGRDDTDPAARAGVAMLLGQRIRQRR